MPSPAYTLTMLAAVTTGAMDVLCLNMLPLGTMFIVQTFAAQLRGKGDLAAAGRYAYYGLFLSLIAAVVGFLLLPLIGPGIGLIGYAPAVERDMEAYIVVRLYSVVALVGTEALGSWYGGLGNTRMPLLASVVTMLSNIFLCYLLIEPRWGLPGYGVVGSAWASTIATAWMPWNMMAMPTTPGTSTVANADWPACPLPPPTPWPMVGNT